MAEPLELELVAPVELEQLPPFLRFKTMPTLPPTPPAPGSMDQDALQRAMGLSIMPEREQWLLNRLKLGRELWNREPHHIESGAGPAAAWGLADALRSYVGAGVEQKSQQGLFDLAQQKLKARQDFMQGMTQDPTAGVPEHLVSDEAKQGGLDRMRNFATAAAATGDPTLQAAGAASLKQQQLDREIAALQNQLAFHQEQIKQHQRALDQKDRQLTEMEKYHASRLEIQKASSVGLRKELFDEKEVNRLGQSDQKTSAALAAHMAAQRLIENLEANHGDLPGVGRVQGRLPNIVSPTEWQTNQADATELVKSALLMKGGAITPEAVELQMKAFGLAPGSDIETFKKGIATALDEVAGRLAQSQSSVKPTNLETYHQRGGLTAADVRATSQRLREVGKKTAPGSAKGGDAYASFRSQLQPGEKLVLNPKGEPEALAPDEQLPAGYTEVK